MPSPEAARQAADLYCRHALNVYAALDMRTQADAAAQVPPELESLMATAQDKGSVRVIVGLDVSFQPEGDLAGPQAVRSQRQRIETTQGAVLAGMEGSNATVIASASMNAENRIIEADYSGTNSPSRPLTRFANSVRSSSLSLMLPPGGTIVVSRITRIRLA